MPKSNGLPPASQPWVRELESRLKALEFSLKNTARATKSAPVQNVDLDNLNVGELSVGGEPSRVVTLADPIDWSKSIQGNTVTFTAPVPTFTYEEDEIGFRLDVEIVATSTVDYPVFTDSWNPPPVPDPEDPEEPENEALAGEETTYTTSFQYSIDDPEDELYEPIPETISVSFSADTAIDVTILESSMKLVTPGVPGLTLTAEGDILFRDEYGSDRPISELTPEDAQAIKDTAKNLADAKAEIDRVDKEAAGNFEELGGKLNTAFPNDIFDVDLAIEQAKQLADQKFNDSITGTVIEYARNSNETSAPTTGWSTTPPTRTPGTFIWMRTIVSYGSGDTTTTDPVLLTGNTGPKGEKGDTGSDGLPGAAGKGIKSTVISYARSTSGATAPTTGWQTQPPTPIKGQYLWTRTVWTYTDNATETGYSSAYWAQDGAKGDDGAAGKDGTTLTGTVQHYAQSTSGTTPPTSGWASQPPTAVPGQYMWTRSTWTYSDGTTEQGYTVGKIGDTGAEGVSVSSITPHYRRLADSVAKPAKPSGMTPSGWVDVEPDYARDTTMWRSDRIVFSNGQIAWTDVSKSSSYEAAKAAEAAALDYADQKKQEAIDAAATTAQTKADVAKQAAIDAAKADLNALEIGGRNLVLDSRKGWESTSYNVIPGTHKLSEPWVVGETYTVTIKGEVNEGQRFGVWRDTGSIIFKISDEVSPGLWRGTAVATETSQASKDRFAVYNYPSAGAEYASIEWIKIERGSKATDWTPAPEDVDAGIADARTIATTADGKATTAQQAADAADGKADTALDWVATAEEVANEALGTAGQAINTAIAAQTTADGKNAVTYSTVGSAPGATPTTASGAGRKQFDMHRNRLSDGTIVAEWMWSGSSWVPVQMGDGVLRSLDVGKLTAGQANLETGVVDKLWANLAVVNKLQALEGWIGGNLLKDGFLSTRHLGVVPEEGTGGVEILPPGIRIIPNKVGEGSAISIRSDEDNWLSFAQNGKSTFSVNPSGDASFNEVDVNQLLTVGGIDVVKDYNSKLDVRPLGIITPVVGLNSNVSIPTAETALMGVSASIPDGPGQRMVRINASLQLHNFTDHVQIQVRGVTSGNVTVSSPSLLITNVNTSSNGQTPVPIEYVWRVPSGADVQVLLTIKSNNSRTGGRVNLQGQTHLYIEDLGTATGYAGVNAGGVLGGTRTFTKTYLPTWGRSYTEENTFYAFDGGNDTRVDHAVAFQGIRDQFSSLRSMVGFDRARILSDLSGATVDKVEIEFVNRSAWLATWLPRIGLHNATSRPATFSTVVNEIYNPSVSRGQRVRAELPSAYVNGWKSGLYSGFVFYDTTKSTSKSFTGSVAVKDCRIHITYRK